MAIRDQAMAEILLTIKQTWSKGEKCVAWAANGHLIKDSFQNHNDSMGHFLHEKIESNYGCILLVASRYETYSAWHSTNPGQKSAPEGSLEHWLESFQKEKLFVNFQKVTHKTLEISERDFQKYSPLQMCDGVIYLRISPAMTLINANL